MANRICRNIPVDVRTNAGNPHRHQRQPKFKSSFSYKLKFSQKLLRELHSIGTKLINNIYLKSHFSRLVSLLGRCLVCRSVPFIRQTHPPMAFAQRTIQMRCMQQLFRILLLLLENDTPKLLISIQMVCLKDQIPLSWKEACVIAIHFPFIYVESVQFAYM